MMDRGRGNLFPPSFLYLQRRCSLETKTEKIRLAIREWIVAPHPFGYLSFVSGVSFCIWTVYNCAVVVMVDGALVPAPIAITLLFYVLVAATGLLVWRASIFLLLFLAILGAKTEGVHFRRNPYAIKRLKQMGDPRAPEAYRNVYRWIIKGTSILFAIWIMLEGGK